MTEKNVHEHEHRKERQLKKSAIWIVLRRENGVKSGVRRDFLEFFLFNVFIGASERLNDDWKYFEVEAKVRKGQTEGNGSGVLHVWI